MGTAGTVNSGQLSIISEQLSIFNSSIQQFNDLTIQRFIDLTTPQSAFLPVISSISTFIIRTLSNDLSAYSNFDASL